MQIYIISNQIDIWYIGFKLSKQGEVFTLMVRWKQTHWNMLAHRMTIKATVFSLGLIIACLLLCFFSFITIWQTTCTCFILTVLKVKKQKNNKKKKQKLCLFEISDREWCSAWTEICRPTHSECHAGREKTLSRASVMPCGCGTCSATLENIRSDFFNNVCVFFLYLLAKTCIVQYFRNMLHIFCIVIHLPTLRLALCFNCFICAYIT